MRTLTASFVSSSVANICVTDPFEAIDRELMIEYSKNGNNPEIYLCSKYNLGLWTMIGIFTKNDPVPSDWLSPPSQTSSLRARVELLLKERSGEKL